MRINVEEECSKCGILEMLQWMCRHTKLDKIKDDHNSRRGKYHMMYVHSRWLNICLIQTSNLRPDFGKGGLPS